MILIIDTNIIYGNWLLKSQETQAFLDFAKKTESTILIPKIAWSEIRKNYKEEFTNKQKSYVDAAKYFSSVLIDKVEFIRIEPEIEKQADEYLDWLQKALQISNKEIIIPYLEDTLDKVAQRAIYKRRPFNPDNQREFKDSLVWQSVLDILEHGKYDSHEDVVLISHDKNAFATDKQNLNLHPDLQNEISLVLPSSFASAFYYYIDLKSFLAKHNTPIASIDLNSITKYLESSESGFSSIFSSIIANTVEYFVEYFYETFPTISFPSLAEDIIQGTYNGLKEGGEFFLYKYQTGAKISIFCTKCAILSVDVNYANYNTPSVVEKVNRELEFYFNATIEYNDETYGSVTIDNISLSEPDEFKFNPSKYLISSSALKHIEDAMFEKRENWVTRREEILKIIGKRRSYSQGEYMDQLPVNLKGKSGTVKNPIKKVKKTRGKKNGRN